MQSCTLYYTWHLSWYTELYVILQSYPNLTSELCIFPAGVTLGTKYKPGGVHMGAGPRTKQLSEDGNIAAHSFQPSAAVDVPVLGQDLVMTDHEIFSMTRSLSGPGGDKLHPESRDALTNFRVPEDYNRPPPPPPRGGHGPMNDSSTMHRPPPPHPPPEAFAPRWPANQRPLSPPLRHEFDPRGMQHQYQGHPPDDRRTLSSRGHQPSEGPPPRWPPPSGQVQGWKDKPINEDRQFSQHLPPPPPPPRSEGNPLHDPRSEVNPLHDPRNMGNLLNDPRSMGNPLNDPRSMRANSGPQTSHPIEPKPRPLFDPQNISEPRGDMSGHRYSPQMPYYSRGPPPDQSRMVAHSGDGSRDSWSHPPGGYFPGQVPPQVRDQVRERPMMRGYHDYPGFNSPREDPRRADPRQRR